MVDKKKYHSNAERKGREKNANSLIEYNCRALNSLCY